MSQRSSYENDLPSVFGIWKMFHSTVTSVYKNLDNGENYLRALANTVLSSKEISEVFIPRYDATLTFKQNQEIEKKYKSMLTWMLGRLFYLLSCEKFPQTHDLFLEAQQGILVALKVKQPHVYNQMIDEYNAALTTINNYLNSLSNPNQNNVNLTINNFVTDNTIINKDDLDLSPISVQLNSINCCFSLQTHLLKLLSESSLCYIRHSLMNDTTKTILSNIVYCSRNSNLMSKIIVIEYCNDLLKQSYYQIREPIQEPTVKELFYEILFSIENFISSLKSNNYFLNSTDVTKFECAIINLFNTVVQNNIVHECDYSRVRFLNICECLIFYKLKGFQYYNNVKFMESNINLLKHILEYQSSSYSNINDIINYAITNNNCGDFSGLLEYQICSELISKINLIDDPKINVLNTSETWKILYENFVTFLDTAVQNKCNFNVIYKSFSFLKNIIEISQKVCITVQNIYSEKKLVFFPFQEFLTRIKNIMNVYQINTSAETQQCLDLIVEIFACITTYIQADYKEFKYIIEIICYPFWKEVPIKNLSVSQNCLITSEFSDHLKIEKQLRALEILSISMKNVEPLEKKYCNEIRMWILNIYKYGVSCKDTNILIKVAKNLILLASTIENSSEMIYDELLPKLLASDNNEVLRLTSEILGKFICILSGNFIVLSSIKETKIDYNVCCMHCDFIKKENEENKLYSLIDNKCYSVSCFTVQQNFTKNLDLIPILKLFGNTDFDVKINLINNLSRFARHIDNFNTINITRKWLNYIVDDNKKVRMNFCQVIKSVINNTQSNSCVSEKCSTEILEFCLKSLVSYSQQYLQTGNAELLETLLDTIKEFGCLPYNQVIYKTAKLMIIYIILCNTYLSFCATDIIKRIAKAHNLTSNLIFIKYKKDFCKTIAEMSVIASRNMEYNVVQSLTRIARAFELSTKEFITKNGHHLLPYYIPCFIKLPETVTILNDLANLWAIEASDLITSSFSYIYTYVYLHEDEHVFKKCMEFVETITKNVISQLKKRSLKVIYNELLLHLYDKRDLVVKELYNLSQEDNEMMKIPPGTPNQNLQRIADYLQPKFLGVLVYFDGKLVSKQVDESVKIRILESLPKIIELMGSKYITPLRFKVLAILRTALTLTDPPYLELICNNFQTFVHCCQVESLGSLLSTIFISILPLWKLFPQKINSIFKYLIIENEEILKDNIPDLFFLSETNISSELKNVVKKYVIANRPNTCQEQFALFLKYIKHENLEVRMYALKFLKKYLEEKHFELEQIILGNNGMDNVLVELIDTLIDGCRENDEQIRLICGECIGELGAIEPSHFPRKYTQTDLSFTFYMSDDSFVINALKELLRSFQMEKDSQNMNRFALAIQEILKYYDISPNASGKKLKLWLVFPPNLQELMLPLLSSRYTVAIQSFEKVTTHPIYGSKIGSSFNEWIYNWTSYLITILKNDKQSLLEVCKPSLKYDYRTSIFFLPHILIHAILEGSNTERKLIHDEFMTVLNVSNSDTKSNHSGQLKLQNNKVFSPFTCAGKSTDNDQNDYLKVIFVLLDYLDRWLREVENARNPKQPNMQMDSHYDIIQSFMNLFCKLQIAKCNFIRGEYPRALVYLEQYVSGDKAKLNEQLGFFARIYAKLEEPDAVTGAMALQETEPSLKDMILTHNVSGHLQDTIACYEIMLQQGNLEPQYLNDMVRCYLELDNPNAALNFVTGMMENYPEYKSMLQQSQAETFWRLNQYDDLEKLVNQDEMKKNTSWGSRMGQTLVHFRNGNRDEFRLELSKLRNKYIDKLSITSLEEGIYRQGYSNIIKLHILNEVEKAENIVYKILELSDKELCEQAINKLIEEWDVRLNIVQASIRVVEPILRLRRIILEQAQHILGSHADNMQVSLNKHIAKYWLKSAEIARRAGIFQHSYIYILKAEPYKPIELFIEKAKLYWAKEEQEFAFNTLKRGIEQHFPDVATFKEMPSTFKKFERKLCAEAKLLIATYNDDTSNVDMDVNISYYREAADMYREWEKSQVALAQYYDRVLTTMSDEDKDLKGGDIQVHIINIYGRSLQYGSKFIYQSMPRMLSIWLDYGTRVIESRPTDDANARDAKKSTLAKMIKIIDTYLDRLPAYMFLSAFSQLVSRICHPVREVYTQIKSILIKLILKYPQQSMWMIMSISKSAYAMRMKRCQEVLQDSRIKNSSVMKVIFDFSRLAEKLIELCNKPISDGVITTSVNTLVKALPRLLQNKDFSEIVVPIQKFRKLVLPNSECNDNQHNPFPNTYVYIIGIEDEVQILQSLQRPRKITFRGSDGKKYIHMLKPKDDLRKDYRLMEFNDVVNLYLHRESESRQRRLCIRTYSVVPLNEECGIVEWIGNLVGLRPILMQIYKQRGLYVSARELKSMMCNVRDTLNKKRDVFEKQLLPRHPPVLADWFRHTFPDAHCWYHARTAYVRTSAAISMVGYILGLGDRHGENILFDSTNGDTVHVDFNCLFNKGEAFDWPERVPFRLTHNMVSAMGPLGVDGMFRKACAVTLRVLRTHTDTLMSIVRPFVYDPLVSWPRNQLLKTEPTDAERTNDQAVEHIRNIELRLQGMIKTRGKSFSISLSCEGQANNLILEATSIDNLSQMYIGWGPFL